MKPLFIQSIKAALSGAAVFAVVLAFLCILSIMQEQAYQRGPKVADNDMVGFAWLILMAIGSVGAIFTMGMAGAWFASREDPTPVYALKVSALAASIVSLPLIAIMLSGTVLGTLFQRAWPWEHVTLMDRITMAISSQAACCPFYIALVVICMALTCLGAIAFIAMRGLASWTIKRIRL